MVKSHRDNGSFRDSTLGNRYLDKRGDCGLVIRWRTSSFFRRSVAMGSSSILFVACLGDLLYVLEFTPLLQKNQIEEREEGGIEMKTQRLVFISVSLLCTGGILSGLVGLLLGAVPKDRPSLTSEVAQKVAPLGLSEASYLVIALVLVTMALLIGLIYQLRKSFRTPPPRPEELLRKAADLWR